MQKIVRRSILSLDGNPIYYRAESDDPEIIDKIFVRDEYGCLGEEVKDPKLIVDCGAYAGYSTLYFLAKYKTSQVVALEPDERNYQLCKLNLEPYKDRVTLIQAALWPEATSLALHENAFGSIQQEWATMVAPPAEHEAAPVAGLDFPAVLCRTDSGDVDLFKMSCASEEAVFSSHYETWLPRVKNIVIRLVDETSENAFFKALGEFQYYLARGPGLFACTHIAPKGPAAAHAAERAADEMLSNGGFDDLRVPPGHTIPGGWLYGSSDIAVDWHAVVCDPQFRVSVAVRTGLQRSAENALCVRLNEGYPILPQSAPYVAIENRKALPVLEGERWSIRAFVKAEGMTAPKTRTRGAYTFLRVSYDDGSYNDLRTLPIFEPTGEYVEIGGVVEVPLTPASRQIERATLWLYVWVENHELDSVPASDYGRWTVFFDDVSCRKVA